MKKLILISSIACLSLMSVILNSCNKKDATTTEQVIVKKARTSYTVTSGILSFSNAEALVAQIEQLGNLNEPDLQAWTSAIPNFMALTEYYTQCDVNAEAGTGNSARKQMEEGTLVEIPDIRLATLLNGEGRVIVGNKIYTYQPNQMLAICPVSALNTSTGVVTLPGNTENINMKTIPVQGILCEGNLLSVEHQWFLKDDNGDLWPTSNNRPVRALFAKWDMWFYFFSSACVKINMERKSTYGGWINIKHDLAISSGNLVGRKVLMGICTDPVNITLLNTNSTFNAFNHIRYFYAVPCVPSGALTFRIFNTNAFITNYSVSFKTKLKTLIGWTH